MSKRKGEMSHAAIDRTWPHQVALHADLCIDDQFARVRDLGVALNAAPVWRQVVKREVTGYEVTYRLICFSRPEEARSFADQVGGYPFDPANNREGSKKSNIWTWREWGSACRRHPEIVARLERVRSWEPELDADIAMLLGMRRPIRFTQCQEEVIGFLTGYAPKGEFEYARHPHIDARFRHGRGEPWRAASEGRARPRDSVATALTLAFLRGWDPGRTK